MSIMNRTSSVFGRRRGAGTAAVAVAAALVVVLLSGCSTKNWKADDWYAEGTSHASKGEHNKAIAAFTRAIELDPEHAPAYRNRGNEYAQAGHYRRALDDQKTVLSLRDKGIPPRETYREIGTLYFKMNKLEDAVAAWQKGLGMAKDDPDLLNKLAMAYLDLGQTEKAGQAALSAYSIDPSLPEVLNTMGEVAMARKEYRQAGNYFVQAIERERGPLYFPVASRYWSAALAFERTRAYDRALEYAGQYVKLEQDPAARQKAYELMEKLRKAMGR
jgi:tetratricopeptide (TPR) repeat protein